MACSTTAWTSSKLGMCAEGTRLQWRVAAFRGQLKAFHCVDKPKGDVAE